jgi:hypothetical protein
MATTSTTTAEQQFPKTARVVVGFDGIWWQFSANRRSLGLVLARFGLSLFRGGQGVMAGRRFLAIVSSRAETPRRIPALIRRWGRYWCGARRPNARLRSQVYRKRCNSSHPLRMKFRNSCNRRRVSPWNRSGESPGR